MTRWKELPKANLKMVSIST